MVPLVEFVLLNTDILKASASAEIISVFPSRSISHAATSKGPPAGTIRFVTPEPE